ncbi:MAG: hypothetical protein H6573_06780 [Lewinellaceae bacterium]|nr:hypothetical protein [Phaeodactylibacter sp.]MCB9347207.1 hypothetical protein [Lewinellaceae bacterium]
MKNLNLAALLLLCFALLQCTKDDQIRVETDITNLPDNTEVSFLIQVVDEDGNPLPGAILTNQLNAGTSTADERGLILLSDLSIPAGGLPVIVELDGWMKRLKVLRGRNNSRTKIRLEMYKFDTESTIATGSTGAISKDGQLSLPAVLNKPDKSTYTGPVKVKSHYYGPTAPDFLDGVPGDMSAIGSNGQLYTLQSYGMYAIELFDDAGNILSIPEGQTAKIQFPVPDNYGLVPDEIPLWSMDESSGKWVEEGVAIRNGGFLEAEVSHFSWWNCDIPFDPTEVCLTIVGQEGTALSGFTYLISSPDQQVAYFYGEADTDGNLCAQVPIGEPVAISVWLESGLTAPVELGSFDTPTDLGAVTIDITVFHVSGRAVDCDGLPLSTGLVWYGFNGVTDYTFSNGDGIFSLVFLVEGALEFQIINQQSAAQSETANLSITANQVSYNVGDMPTCEDLGPGQPILITEDITTDVTWTSDRVYILGGRINVIEGATLTIQPATIIKGQVGEGVNATALFIARGSKLMAEGTADAPIIFTSILDEIMPDDVAAGNFASPNLAPEDNGWWGGVVLMGKARISAQDVGEVLIEGAPANDINYYYGGDDDADNSGVLRYVSIRHGGANIGAGNEINGLTLAAVGSGTTIEHIEIVGCRDDGIEWFGGSVNVMNVVVWNVGDDGIDTDQAWSGTLDNFVVITPGSSCFELDGPEGIYVARHTIQNGTVVAVANGRAIGGSLIDVDSITPVDMKNIHFVAPLDGLTLTEDEVDNSTFENVTFAVNQLELPSLMEQGGAVPAGISAGGSPVANVSVLSWTWAAQAGGLDGL